MSGKLNARLERLEAMCRCSEGADPSRIHEVCLQAGIDTPAPNPEETAAHWFERLSNDALNQILELRP